MKTYFRSILNTSALFLSWLYPYRIVQYAKILFFYKIYSFVMQRQFKNTGSNLSINPGIILHGAKHIVLGNNVSIQSGCWIAAHDEYFGYHYSPQLTIGNSVTINFNCHIACINSITIGDDTLISSNVLITDHTHGETTKNMHNSIRRKQPLLSKGAIVIGKNVWIGEKASIMSGVHIGDNTIIGANSVVTKNIPSNSIAVGSPAKVIRKI